MISANNSFITLRKTLKISFMSKTLNFFYLFMIFKMLFLIICKSDFTACSYSKFFMSFKFICDFSKKKLYCNIFAFFYIMRTACHLKQLLNHDVVLKQYRDSTH